VIKVTNEVREAAQRLLAKLNAVRIRDARREPYTDKDRRKRLEAIVEGKRKLIEADWWREVHGDIDRAKLDKIAALADPARNSSEHERQVASTKLAAAKARRPPGMRPKPPPLPEDINDWVDRRKTRKSKKTKPPPTPQPSRNLSDSVAAPVQHVSDSVASAPDGRLKALNARRAAQRAANRASLKCQTCGKPLAARRVTARYCNATCRSQAWRHPGTDAKRTKNPQ
jgi:hypothetical protein